MSDGSLTVRFETKSGFLTSALPVEIRDAHNELVTRSTGWTRVDVPAGLYVVEATLPGGIRHSEVVEVAADEPRSVVLEAANTSDALVHAENPVPSKPALHFAPAVELTGSEECGLLNSDSTSWLFEPTTNPHAVPFATFLIGGQEVTASLPLNPRGRRHEERAALVRFTWTGDGYRAAVGFVPQRRVAWTLEGLVKAGDMVSAEQIFRNADDLLLHKYADPAAAALGGLTLLRMGRLENRSGWVENLARDFEWIVDGVVLRAALLAKADSEGTRHRGLELLLANADRRPMFSDGLALMLKLLRAWPDGSAPETRREALSAIAIDPTAVDWNAMALTTYREI